ncbi:MAG: lipoate--protein ligase family protein [Sulfurimonas sp.]|nr:lipoate--protein ligase family protein [Sulfurimonas sp.]
MAVDEALLSNFKESDLPILRLYRWEPSLSLGRFSNLSQSVNLEILKKRNLSFVRRMTGGGILVHGGDISYSLVLPRESLKDIGVKKSYRYLCGFLIKLYEKLELNAKFAHDLNFTTSKSNICMTANEPYDIIIGGKKIGGNAQRYTKDTLFQHGSVPLSLNHNIFKDVFLEDSGLESLATLDRIGKEITDEQLTYLLTEAFSQSFKANFVRDTLNQLELQSAENLLRDKYSTKRWNLNAN